MPGLPQLTQTYSYDHLNRLTNAQESGGGANWAQTYNYDAFGNRWIGPTQSTGLPALTLETPQAQSWYSSWTPPAGCAPRHPNQINPWCYDANGNVLQEGTVARSFTYDGENRQVTACLNCAQGSPTATYMYDGQGQRVSKTVGGQTTTYVYDAFGNLAAEYGGSSALACGTCYVTTDHLGSTRLLTNSAGGVAARYDYEPFGQEIGAGYDGRTAPLGYTSSPDGGNPKFTGQQRDQETALDWFNVRSMSGAQGRFQSPDPGNVGADPSNPQSWNGYAYVGNNPLSYTDPSGMFVEATAGGCAFGGPIGFAIGAAIDIGAILAGIFGSGGPPPSIPPSLATPSSPILGPDVADLDASFTGSGGATSQHNFCLATPNFIGRALLGGLVSAARAVKGTVGYGVGGSIGGGLGLGIGINASASVQVIASQDGTAGFAITVPSGTVTPDNASMVGFGTKGFGGILGVQVTGSTGKTVMDAEGVALDASGSIAPEGLGVALAGDISVGTGTRNQPVLTGTGTVGIGFGGKASGGQRIHTTVIPFCSHF
jgi:RHS repeat-associated protein